MFNEIQSRHPAFFRPSVTQLAAGNYFEVWSGNGKVKIFESMKEAKEWFKSAGAGSNLWKMNDSTGEMELVESQ